MQACHKSTHRAFSNVTRILSRPEPSIANYVFILEKSQLEVLKSTLISAMNINPSGV